MAGLNHWPQAVTGRMPRIAISMGDPLGVGPEVIAKALARRDVRQWARYRIYGDANIFARAASACNITPYWHVVEEGDEVAWQDQVGQVIVVNQSVDIAPSAYRKRAPSAISGSASLRSVDSAIADCQCDAGADAMATAPISKEAWSMAGFARWPGHTEMLAERCRAKSVVMMFDAPHMRVALATCHVPLMQVGNHLSMGCVLEAITQGVIACQRLGIARPRIGVCGLNPHAGENGLLGHEEKTIIRPALTQAIENGIHAEGPLPADTLFIPSKRDRYDLIVAMYHDQGLIPVKMHAFDEAVNITLGLPIIRTSPDHGTAWDIAGKGIAREHSMVASIRSAAELASGHLITCPTALQYGAGG